MRLTRRGCFVPKGMLYVWYVYSTAWEAEEFETGTFTPSRYGGNRMAADSYETSQDGFTLINPSSTSSSQLQVGDYLVLQQFQENIYTGSQAKPEAFGARSLSTQVTKLYRSVGRLYYE